MGRLSYSLVTYTYEDATLVNGLLESALGWTEPPERIIVVDDGSSQAYAPPFNDERLRVIRNIKNLGVTRTKGIGIAAAETPYVLSVDCDSRLSDDWISSSSRLVRGENVALVSSPISHKAFPDMASRYWAVYGDLHNHDSPSEVDFLTGGVWLLSKEIWERVGGFEGYEKRTFQDHYYCAKLRKTGCRLMVNSEVEALQVRRMSRRAIARKLWTWIEAIFKDGLQDERRFWDQAVSFFLSKTFERIEMHIADNAVEFIYIEILYVVCALHDVLLWAEKGRGYSPECRMTLLRNVAAFGNAHPNFMRLLAVDAPELMGAKSPGGIDDSGFFHDFFGFLSSSGLMRLVDLRLGPIVAESRTARYDYSMYEGA